MNKNSKTFKGVVNVSFTAPIGSYPEIKKLLTKKMEELEKIDPTGVKHSIPTLLAYKTFKSGTVLTFGDDLEYETIDNNFRITVYPKSLFDHQSNRYVEMPCKMKGNVVKAFNDSYANLPPEEQASLGRKKDILKEYLMKPVMKWKLRN